MLSLHSQGLQKSPEKKVNETFSAAVKMQKDPVIFSNAALISYPLRIIRERMRKKKRRVEE
jgi:hypothetical protein